MSEEKWKCQSCKFICFVLVIFIAVLNGCSATADPLSQTTKDRIARLEWSKVSKRLYQIRSAHMYCWDLNEKKYGGHNDWRLPTIDELRSIIKNCPGTELEGKCRISEENDNLSYIRDYARKYCHACEWKHNSQEYSKIPLNGVGYISSKSRMEEPTDYKWVYYGVDFSDGNIWLDEDDDENFVLCVRDR